MLPEDNMTRRGTMSRQHAPDPVDSAASINPLAETMTAEQFQRAVAEFYGTKTLVFDRPFAEEVLQLNSANRRVNARKLGQLVAQMKAGSFENTGEPIIIAAEGILNDGQHRLLAVIESDAVVDMDVRFGIPRKSFSKTDTGAGRTGGDVLAIRGLLEAPPWHRHCGC